MNDPIQTQTTEWEDAVAASRFLEELGYRFDYRWGPLLPNALHKPTEKEASAIKFLQSLITIPALKAGERIELHAGEGDVEWCYWGNEVRTGVASSVADAAANLSAAIYKARGLS